MRPLITAEGARTDLKGPAMAVDMVNVGWGDCFLVHCIEPYGQRVYRILVDGGARGQGALEKVAELVIPHDSSESVEFDLLVGTHYDADHLQGLIDIVEDRRFRFKEAWLPPVLDESIGVLPDLDRGIAWLAKRLDDGTQDEICKYLTDYGRLSGDLERVEQFLKHAKRRLEEASAEAVAVRQDDPICAALESDRRIQGLISGECNQHEEFGRWQLKKLVEIVSRFRPQAFGLSSGQIDWLEKSLFADEPFWANRPYLERPLWTVPGSAVLHYPAIQVMAGIQLAIVRSRAKGAIIATNLDGLVQALKSAAVPMRCPVAGGYGNDHWALEGSSWRNTHRRKRNELHITHLSPGRQLIQKLADRIPRFSMAHLTRPSITSSNRLSHVFNIHLSDFAVLLTGDSGFDDFPRESPRNKRQQALLDEVAKAQLIKVPHHAGHYGRFGQTMMQVAQMRNCLKFMLVTSGPSSPKAIRPASHFSKLIKHLHVHGKQTPPRVIFSNPPRKELYELCPRCPTPNRRAPPHIRLEAKGRGWHLSDEEGICCLQPQAVELML